MTQADFSGAAYAMVGITGNAGEFDSYFKFDGPRQHLSALAWGNCGFATGAVMGTKMGAPDQPVFSLMGDGAWGIGGLDSGWGG